MRLETARGESLSTARLWTKVRGGSRGLSADRGAAEPTEWHGLYRWRDMGWTMFRVDKRPIPATARSEEASSIRMSAGRRK
jgi:hypothetical protein